MFVILTNLKHVSTGLDPKEIHGSMSKILRRFPQWISPRIFRFLSPILARFPARLHRDFLPQWICFSARILVRFAVGFWWGFGRQDYSFPARILVRFVAGSRQDFGHQDFCFLARFAVGSQRDFGCQNFSFLPRSWSLFYKVKIMQDKQTLISLIKLMPRESTIWLRHNSLLYFFSLSFFYLQAFGTSTKIF